MRALWAAALVFCGCAMFGPRVSKEDLAAFRFDRTVRCPDPNVTEHWSIDGEGNVDFFAVHHHFESENLHRTKKLDEKQLRALVRAVRKAKVASTKQTGPYGRCMDCCWADIEIRTAAGGKAEDLEFEGYVDIDEGWRKLILELDDLAGLEYF